MIGKLLMSLKYLLFQIQIDHVDNNIIEIFLRFFLHATVLTCEQNKKRENDFV